MFFKKSDIIVVSIIIAVSITSWAAYKLVFSDEPAQAEIYYGSQLVKVVDLNQGKELTFTIPQNENILFHLYKDGSICFEKSDCPDKVCVNTGELHNIGEYAACLPNKIILKIVGKRDTNDNR